MNFSHYTFNSLLCKYARRIIRLGMMVLLVLNCIGASGFTAREPVIEAAEALINRMIPQMAARVHFRKISDDQEIEKHQNAISGDFCIPYTLLFKY